MSKPFDYEPLQALSTRINGSASLLTALYLGFIEITPETIGNVITTLRDVADKLEEMTREGDKNA
jgi:hypothetical protein